MSDKTQQQPAQPTKKPGDGERRDHTRKEVPTQSTGPRQPAKKQ
jgi:hypothetical protein